MYTTLVGMDWTLILMIVLVFGAMYLLMIRPQQKRMREQQQMQSSIKEGSRVMLTSGIFGTVKAVGTRQIVLEITPGVDMTIVKEAVASVVTTEDDEFEYVDEEKDADAEQTPALEPAVLDEKQTEVSSPDKVLAESEPLPSTGENPLSSESISTTAKDKDK